MKKLVLAACVFGGLLAGTSTAATPSNEVGNGSSAQKEGGGIESTGCGYEVSEQSRVELMKAGFAFMDSNHLGYSFFSKLNYVYPDKIYAKHYNGEIWRVVYLGQPAVYKDYVGMTYTCGLAYGYPLKDGGGRLTQVNLGSISILDNYTPPK